MSTGIKIPFLSLKTSNAPFAKELTEAASRVIASGWYLHGPETAAFEQELLQSCGIGASEGSAVGVSNGLDALRLIFRAYIENGVLHPGDEVLVPANTYIASILPLTEFGLKPVLIEPDPSTFGIDWRLAEQAVTPRTRALLTVHLYGHPSWDFEVARRLRGQGILIVEDNAQAIGASVITPSGESIATGALGDAAAFSFYPTKNIGALGDAGAVVTRDPVLAKTVKALANYGTDRRYHNIYAGYNCRLDELQAAFLRVKLRHLDEIGRQRREIARVYLEEIRHPEVSLPADDGDNIRVWHQFTILSPRRDALRQWLESNGIATDIHYAVPPHMQPCYSGLADHPLPLTERIADEILSLPIADLSLQEAREIAGIINSFPEM